MRKGILSLARWLVVLALVMFALGVGRLIWALTTSPPPAALSAAALAEALRAGRLGGAALDVRMHEPPGSDDPLAVLDNVLLTPHIAGLTAESQARVCAAVADDVLRVLRGSRPLFAVQ